ncbi:hypothetical protein MKO06_02935 [Gramella sp. GC03-9]|uniref:Uncharacterized protein n=1 Tax=Christiangramia oceanisediminis TaxID=2920386 RepID=A0A9X2I1C4_9FLAO|nr:hypothetical protein [Gramella oceanisediminis]MCP9198845.1 hypothetical protein [Gramella oceanisediminis]
MKDSILKHSSLFLLILLAAGPIAWTTHLVLEEHANIYELDELKISKKTIPHWGDHFLHAQYKGILPKILKGELTGLFPSSKKDFLHVGISHSTFNHLRFYVRGPPEGTA